MKLSLPFILAAASTMIGEAWSCEQTYPLIAGGGNGIGTNAGKVVIEDNGSTLHVVVKSGIAAHAMYHVHAEAQCQVKDFPLTNQGSPKVGQMDVNLALPDGTGVAAFDLYKPDCGDAPILVGVHAEVQAKGGMEAFNLILPLPVVFRLQLDSGSDIGASYFDTTFVGESVLSGLTIDGYCVDVSHTINLGTTYTGTAYSYLDPALEATNIDKPENFDMVAWVINNFVPGQTYEADANGDGVMDTYTLTSGTLQRAIWQIIDDNQSTSGLGSWDENWALYIADEAMAVEMYEPGCGDLVPIILVPDDGGRQHITIQTTFASVQIPCEVSAGQETAWAVMPGQTEPLGYQFDGANWFTYVTFDACE